MIKNPRRALQMLLESSALLSSRRDLGSLLKTILSTAARVVHSETASILLLDSKTQELYFHLALGLDPKVSGTRLKIGEGIAGKVAEGGKPVIIDAVQADPRWSSAVDKLSGFHTRSILAAPMTVQGRLIGVVEAINPIDGNFTQDDLHLFEAFAAQAAVAVDGAQLIATLNEEKTLMDIAFSQMREGILLADEQGSLLLANPAASRLLGFEGSPRTISEALSRTQISPALDILFSQAKDPRPFEIVREKPKRLILEGTAFSFQFKEISSQKASNVFFLVFRNVTDERQEEFLKSSFLSLISHKLRTPLASIVGFSDILLSEAQLPESIVKPLHTISAQGRKLSELVEKLLAFTTVDGLDPSSLDARPFYVDSLIQEALGSLETWLLAQDAEITVETDKKTMASGDAYLMRQVLKNLIENGVKFNTRSKKKLWIRSAIREDSVEIRVQDNGPGIPPEDLEKVFGKFHQVEAFFTGQVEGAGLGLPFVKRVVEFHGGQIWLESRLAEGTTAVITLPRSNPS